ncbi:hypothetical protein WJX73_007988 [Symbiochloris irregularis]|uniref:Transmembrane protein n=1 Tax=Symbiochloris irregularis TaxID=706552 RepID=A0AAW1NRI1_9CHLO
MNRLPTKRNSNVKWSSVKARQMMSCRRERSRHFTEMRRCVSASWVLLAVLVSVLCQVSSTDGLFTDHPSDLVNTASVKFCRGGHVANCRASESSWRVPGHQGPGWVEWTWMLLEELGKLRGFRWKALGLVVAVGCFSAYIFLNSACISTLLVRCTHLCPFWRDCLPEGDSLSDTQEEAHNDAELPAKLSGEAHRSSNKAGSDRAQRDTRQATTGLADRGAATPSAKAAVIVPPHSNHQSSSNSSSSSVCSDWGAAQQRDQVGAELPKEAPRKAPTVLVVPRRSLKAPTDAVSAKQKAVRGAETPRPAQNPQKHNGKQHAGSAGKAAAPASVAAPAETAAPLAAEPSWPVVTPSRPYAQVAREAAGGAITTGRPADRPTGPPQITLPHQIAPAPTQTPPAAFTASDNRWQLPQTQIPGHAIADPHHPAFPHPNFHVLPPPMEPSAPPSLFATSHYDPVMTPDVCNASLLGGGHRGLHTGGTNRGPDNRDPFMGDSLTSLAGISLRRRSAPLSPPAPQDDWSRSSDAQNDRAESW